MNVDKLRQIVAEDESQTNEFKIESEKQADLDEVIVSFANAEGGNLLVGVTDNGEIIGVKNVKSVVDRLHSAARRIDPPLNDGVSVVQIDCDGNTVVAALVPDSLEATYSLSGRFRIREGSFNRLMSSADVIEHATRRGTLYYENVPARGVGLDVLAEEKVKAFLATRLQAGMPDRPLDELLLDMGAAAQDEEKIIRPSVGGLHTTGYVDRFGIGVIRMKEAMEQAGLPAPKFVSTPASFEVTLTPASTDPSAYSSTATDSGTVDNGNGTDANTSEFWLHAPWYTQTWSAARGSI